MAINDELDQLLVCEKVANDDWEALCEILDMKTVPGPVLRRKSFNEEIRHNYGHTAMNLFRDEFNPDYVEILRATAEKMKVSVKDHHSVAEIEDKLIVEAIDSMKAQIIKEQGPEGWEVVEKEIATEIETMAAEGKFDPSVAAQLKQYRGAALMTALLGGKLAGFALYQVAMQGFFAMSRALGLKIGVAAAGPLIGKTLAFLLGPVGWAVSAAWLAFDLGNTNWKKTIPSVLTVAVFRRKYELV